MQKSPVWYLLVPAAFGKGGVPGLTAVDAEVLATAGVAGLVDSGEFPAAVGDRELEQAGVDEATAVAAKA